MKLKQKLEAVVQTCSVKKSVLRNFTKFRRRQVRPATLLKRRLWQICFPVNFAKFLRTFFCRAPLAVSRKQSKFNSGH